MADSSSLSEDPGDFVRTTAKTTTKTTKLFVVDNVMERFEAAKRSNSVRAIPSKPFAVEYIRADLCGESKVAEWLTRIMIHLNGVGRQAPTEHDSGSYTRIGGLVEPPDVSNESSAFDRMVQTGNYLVDLTTLFWILRQKMEPINSAVTVPRQPRNH